MRRLFVVMAVAALALELATPVEAGHRRCFRRARCCGGYGVAAVGNYSGGCCAAQTAYGQTYGTQAWGTQGYGMPANTDGGFYHGQQSTVGYPPNDVAPAPAVESSTTIDPSRTFQNQNDGRLNRAPGRIDNQLQPNSDRLNRDLDRTENKVDRQIDRAEDKVDRAENKADREVDRAQEKADRDE